MTDDKNVEVMKKHVMSFCRQDDKKAWAGLAISLAFEVLAVALIHWGAGSLGWILHTWVTVRLFVQFHDMAHYSYFTSISLNRWIGKMLGVYVHFPFDSWRNGHNHHHKHFGNLDRLDLSQTILFTKKQYEKMSPSIRAIVRFFREPIVFFLFSAPFVWFVGLFYSIVKREGVLSGSFWEKVLSVVIWTWVCPMLGIPAVKMWLSVIGTNLIGTALFHLQHAVNLPYRERKEKWDFTRAAIEGSTYLLVPGFLRIFTNGIEYHHIHHFNTNVASYNIEECHNSFDKSEDPEKGLGWDKLGINRVDLPLAAVSMFNVMLNEETGRLEPFSYGF